MRASESKETNPIRRSNGDIDGHFSQKPSNLIVIGIGSSTVISAGKCLLKTRLDIWVKKGRRIGFYDLIFLTPDPKKARCHIKSNNKTARVARPI